MRGSAVRARARTTFCWLPPDNCPTGLSASGVAIARALIISCASASCWSCESRSQPAPLGLQAQNDVLAHGQFAEHALGLAVLGTKGDAEMERMARRGRRNLFAADRQASGIRLDRAEYELGDLGAAGPEESGEPDDLACVQSEIERLHDPPSSESLGDQNRLILDRRGGARRVLFGAFELPSQHQRESFSSAAARRSERSRRGGRCAGPRYGPRFRKLDR